MKPALHQSLHAAFPHLLSYHVPSPSSPNHSTLAIGDGWYTLFHTLCTSLQTTISSQKLDPEEYYFSQVKQKFGSLRVYMSRRHEGIRAAVAKAEDESLEICEACGKEGTLGRGGFTGGWVCVRCEDCRETERVEREGRQARWRARRERRDSGYGEVGG